MSLFIEKTFSPTVIYCFAPLVPHQRNTDEFIEWVYPFFAAKFLSFYDACNSTQRNTFIVDLLNYRNKRFTKNKAGTIKRNKPIFVTHVKFTPC